MDTATVSVIVSGCVAIAGLLFPLVFGLFTDWFKWRRERNAANAERVNSVTVELLETLSKFLSREVLDRAPEIAQEAYSDLLRRYYAWERVISPHCHPLDRARLRELRADIEARNYVVLESEGPRLANNILGFADVASGRRKRF